MKISAKIREEVGARINEARKATGLNLTEFAKAIGVTQSAISQWESGATSPNIQSIFCIESVSGYAANWIATGEGPKETDGAEFARLIKTLDRDELVEVLRLASQLLSEQKQE